MNPLQDYPHLFANGKFKVTHPNWGGAFTFGLQSEFITECMSDLGAELKDCTLIARPISDMTSDEWSKHWFCGEFGYDEWKDKNRYCSYKQMPFVAIEDFLYIGVYPFEQFHFKQGIVIDATKIEKVTA